MAARYAGKGASKVASPYASAATFTERDQFDLAGLDHQLIVDCIAAVAARGDAITFSLTRDRSGLFLSLYDGQERVKIFAGTVDEATAKLEAILGAAGGL